jgi:hypothetical protein
MAGPAIRLLAAAGAVVFVAGGGFELVTHLGESTGSGASSSGSSSQNSSTGAGSGTSRLAEPAARPALHYQVKGRPATIAPVRTAMNYRRDSLGKQAAEALSRHGPTPGPVRGGTMSPDAGPGAQATHQLSRLSACVNLIAAGHRVLLVDLARFNRAPATLIVTAGPGAAREAWIVGPRCSASAGDVLARQPLPGSG